MGTSSRYAHRAINALISICAAGLLMAGCSAGGTGTTSAGIDEGPLVPFSFTASGKPGAVAKPASDQAADVVATPVEGHFGMTETDNTDTCNSSCTFNFGHRVSSSPNVWVTACSEVAGTACSIPGHTIEISDNPTYCAGKDNCLTAVISPSTSASSTCSLFLSGNKLSSRILTGGLDHVDVTYESDFTCLTTAVGDFHQAGVRIATVVGTDASGAATFPSALDGTVSFLPSAGFASDATLDAMYDEGYTWTANQKQSAVYRVADKDNMNISAKVDFPITLTGDVRGGTVVAPPQYGLLAGLQLCDEIDTGPSFCSSVADALSPTMVKLGSSLSSSPVAKLSVATFSNGERIATMKTTATATASIKSYDNLSATWRDVTSFNDYTANQAIDDIAATINEYTEDLTAAGNYAATVSVMTTDRTSLNGTVYQSQDGFTWTTLGTIDEAMEQASVVSDLRTSVDTGFSEGNVFVGYKDAAGMAAVAYCTANGCVKDSSLASAVEQLAGFASVTAISNLAYDSFNETVYVAVSWKDANGGDHVTVFQNGDGWYALGNTIDATASRMSLAAASAVSNDALVSVTALAYVDENNMVHEYTYSTNNQTWSEIIGIRDNYTAVDSTSRVAMAVDRFANATYTAVRDSTALKLVKADLAANTVAEVATVELNGYTTNSAAIAIPAYQTVDIAYMNATLGYAIAKEGTFGVSKTPCNGRICGTDGGPK